MKLGFIGMGNMAEAIAGGFIRTKKIEAENIFAYAPNQEKLKANAARMGFIACASNKEVVEKSDIIFLACKPYQLPDVLPSVTLELKGKAVVNLAAGWNFDSFAEYFDTEKTRLLCIKPNTPAKIGAGVTFLEEKTTLTKEELSVLTDMFMSLGLVETIPSRLMGIAGAVAGCGPAFFDMIIEGYADAAVKYGMPRKQAYRIVSQTMFGAAGLQLATGEHPGVLKDQVTTPGGTTIRGISSLEESGIRSACIKSIDAIMNMAN